MEMPVWSASGSGQFEFGNAHNSTEGREERGCGATSLENPEAWLCPEGGGLQEQILKNRDH